MKKVYSIKGFVTKGTKASAKTIHVAHEDLRAGIDDVMKRMRTVDEGHVADLCKQIGRVGLLEGRYTWNQAGEYYNEGAGESAGRASIEIIKDVELLA